MDQFKISDYLQDYNKDTKRGTCKSCQKPVLWSKDNVAAHKRASCASASDEEKKKFAKRRRLTSFNTSADNISFEGEESTSSGSTSFNLTEEQIKECNTKLANFFFRTGISFRLADSEAFKDFVTSLNPTYARSMANSKALAGPLLEQHYARNSSRLQEIISESSNLTLISDGWTNIRGDHIVNFCIRAPNHKPFFISSINSTGIRQDAQAVADEIITVIEKIGSEKFSCVITDNAAVMRAAWKIIEGKFPHISANGCAAHGTNLLIKNILETPECSKTIKHAEKIIKFVSNHHIVKAKYEAKRKAAKVPHTLSMPVVTRWFSHYTSLSHLCDSKYVLMKLVDEESEVIQGINPKQTSATVMGLIKSIDFWERWLKVVKDIEFPANVIGKLEADNAPLS